LICQLPFALGLLLLALCSLPFAISYFRQEFLSWVDQTKTKSAMPNIEINYVAILIAVVANFILGFL